MAKNRVYSNESNLISRLKLEDKEREKHNLETMKANDDFYRQHILGKKDNNNHFVQVDKMVDSQFADTSKVEDDKVNQENKPAKNKKTKELRSFLGYKNRTAFCIAKNYQLFKLNACIDKLNNDKQEINEENIANYMNKMDNRLNKINQLSTNLIDDEKIRKEQQEDRIAKLAGNKIIQDAVRKYETKTIEKQQDEIKAIQNGLDGLGQLVEKLRKETQEEINKMLDSNNVKTDNIVIELGQIKKEVIKNRNRIKGLDWYFEKKLTNLRDPSKCSLDTKSNFIRTHYVKGIYRILALGLLYILTNDVIISTLRLIK